MQLQAVGLVNAWVAASLQLPKLLIVYWCCMLCCAVLCLLHAGVISNRDMCESRKAPSRPDWTLPHVEPFQCAWSTVVKIQRRLICCQLSFQALMGSWSTKYLMPALAPSSLPCRLLSRPPTLPPLSLWKSPSSLCLSRTHHIAPTSTQPLAQACFVFLLACVTQCFIWPETLNILFFSLMAGADLPSCEAAETEALAASSVLMQATSPDRPAACKGVSPNAPSLSAPSRINFGCSLVFFACFWSVLGAWRHTCATSGHRVDRDRRGGGGGGEAGEGGGSRVE